LTFPVYAGRVSVGCHQSIREHTCHAVVERRGGIVIEIKSGHEKTNQEKGFGRRTEGKPELILSRYAK
jgi:hypothetical protein